MNDVNISTIFSVVSAIYWAALFVALEWDQGLVITTSQAFTGWGGLSDQLANLTSVPCGPSHAVFQPANGQKLPPAQGEQPLQQLLDAAWCTTLPVPSGVGPANQSAACQCVADAFAFLVTLACHGHAASGSVAPSAANLSYAGKQVVKCLVYPPQYQIRTVGNDFGVLHPAAVTLYCNGVLFMVCTGYSIMFGWTGPQPYWTRKLVLAGIALVYAIPFVSFHPASDYLNGLGFFVVLWVSLYTLHVDLDPAQFKVEDVASLAKPHPLAISLYAVLQLLIPGYTTLIAISGYARDTGPLVTFGCAGSLLGLAIQVSSFLFVFVAPWQLTRSLRRGATGPSGTAATTPSASAASCSPTSARGCCGCSCCAWAWPTRSGTRRTPRRPPGCRSCWSSSSSSWPSGSTRGCSSTSSARRRVRTNGGGRCGPCSGPCWR
jgi:hypothetical protein